MHLCCLNKEFLGLGYQLSNTNYDISIFALWHCKKCKKLFKIYQVNITGNAKNAFDETLEDIKKKGYKNIYDLLDDKDYKDLKRDMKMHEKEKLKHVFGYVFLENTKDIKINKTIKKEVAFYPCYIFNNSYKNIEINSKIKVFQADGFITKKNFYECNNFADEFNQFNEKQIFTYTTKSFKLIRQLTFNDLKDKYLKRYKPLIETEKEYNNCDDYKTFAKNKFFNIMKDIGFKESLITVIFEDLNKKDMNLLDYLNKISAYKEENISKDTLVELATRY